MSPRLAWILVASLALPAVSLAQAAAEEEVVKAIHARLEAVRRNDLAAWATLVADDMMAPVEGPTRSKQILACATQVVAAGSELLVRAAAGREGARRRRHRNRDVSLRSVDRNWRPDDLRSQVADRDHVRRNGRWLLLGVADGLIPPEPKTAKIEASILDAYVGRYEWAPTLVSKIERKGDRLLEHLGAGEPVEWRPETATTFYMPGAAAGGDTSRITFAKDAGGRITHYIYRELGATDRIVRRSSNGHGPAQNHRARGRCRRLGRGVGTSYEVADHGEASADVRRLGLRSDREVRRRADQPHVRAGAGRVRAGDGAVEQVAHVGGVLRGVPRYRPRAGYVVVEEGLVTKIQLAADTPKDPTPPCRRYPVRNQGQLSESAMIKVLCCACSRRWSAQWRRPVAADAHAYALL
jgi:hypothetical protein